MTFESTTAMPKSAKYALLVLLVACRSRGAMEGSEPTPTAIAPQDAAVAQAVTPLPKEAANVRIVYPVAPRSLVDLVRAMRPSVVHLRSTTKVNGGPGALIPDRGISYALGSGFLLDRKGHIVTSEHVISSAPEIFAVLASGEEFQVQVIGRDTELDVALVKIDAPVALLHPVRLGDSTGLQIGEQVLALGNPLGTEVTASAGIISSLGATYTRPSELQQTPVSQGYESFLRTDAKIDAGNSGGPLIDHTGAVIGINCAVSTQAGDRRFAIPIDRAKQIFPMLKSDGAVVRAWLGVYVHPVDMAMATERKMKIATGALVSEVVVGSPAARAGILAGDVILEFDNKPVDHKSLPWISATTGIGRQVPVTVWRDGHPKQILLLSAAEPK